MVTMLVRRACISSLSSKISSYQGVLFQSISRRGNLGLIGEESGTCAPDVPGPPDAWSIWVWSLTRSSSTPPGLALMGSTSIILGKVGTSPTAPPAPASSAWRDSLSSNLPPATKSSFYHLQTDGGVAVPALSAKDATMTLGSGDLVREGEA
jgi:hypothetical protein